jgi:hypothetical protein
MDVVDGIVVSGSGIAVQEVLKVLDIENPTFVAEMSLDGGKVVLAQLIQIHMALNENASRILEFQQTYQGEEIWFLYFCFFLFCFFQIFSTARGKKCTWESGRK